MTARERGIDHHPVARTKPFDSSTYLVDGPGAVRPNYMRIAVPDPGQSFGDEEVQAVERHRLDADHHLPGAWGIRFRQLLYPEVSNASRSAEDECLHRVAGFRRKASEPAPLAAGGLGLGRLWYSGTRRTAQFALGSSPRLFLG